MMMSFSIILKNSGRLHDVHGGKAYIFDFMVSVAFSWLSLQPPSFSGKGGRG